MSETVTSAPYAVKKAQEAQTDFDPGGSSFHSYLSVLWKRKRILLTSVITTTAIAFSINLTQKPVYYSSAEVVLQPKESDLSSQNISASSVMQDPTFMLTQLHLLRSPVLAERILRRVDRPENRKPLLQCFSVPEKGEGQSKESVFSEKERAPLLRSIRGSLSARQLESGARIITIGVRGHDPRMVKELADAASETYIEINYESQIEAFKQSFSVISRSLSEIREKIKTGEIALQKVTKELELYQALKVYGEKHPLVVSLMASVNSLSEKLVQSSQTLGGLELGRRKDVLSLITQPHVTVDAIVPIESDLLNLKPILEQEVNTNRDMYNSIFKKLQEVELSGNRSIWSDAKIIEPAAVPSAPISPNKRLNFFIALFAGLGFGLGLAYFLEYLDSSIRSLIDVRNYLKVMPLGMVPLVHLDPDDEEKRAALVEGAPSIRSYWNTSDSNLPLYVAEAYRIIRTSLSFGSLDRSLKLIQVTSAVKGEGKTTTACNLGISFAQAGLRTLLIDADMRRPSLHNILQLGDHESGLSNVLASGDSWKDVVRPTKVENLYCITSGVVPPNPSELLSSKRVKRLLDELKEEFDFVIFDSPPIISVADAPIIASHVDGTILVVRAGFIPRHMYLHAKNAIETVHGKIIGCILNCVSSHHQSYYYSRQYGYNDYYSYYGDAGKGDGKTKAKENKTFQTAGSVSVLEKIKLLKEPLKASLAQGWAHLSELMKWERRM